MCDEARGNKGEAAEHISNAYVLEKLQEETMELSNKTTTNGDIVLTAISASLTTRRQEGQSNHAMVIHFMMTSPRNELVKSQNTLDSKNSELNVSTCNNTLFKMEQKQLTGKENSIEATKLAMMLVSTLLLTIIYGAEHGSIQWAAMKHDIAFIKQQMDIRAGRDAASAEAETEAERARATEEARTATAPPATADP